MCPPPAAVSAPAHWLKVPIHLQDDLNACGRACAEMVLLFLTETLYQQTELKPPSASSGTSPDELCSLINDRLPDGFVRYRVYSETTLKDAMDRVWRGLQKGYPAVSLCQSNAGHWVVIRAITDGIPAVAHIRNPLPHRTQVIKVRPLPVHSSTDNCHDLDLMNNSRPTGEVAPVCSPYCVARIGDHAREAPYAGSYVVVAPDLPAVGEVGQYRCESPDHRDITVGQLAYKRLEETGLLESPEWSVFAAAPLADDGISVSVDGLYDPDDSFDLVQLTNTAGAVALVRLSTKGKFVGAMLEPSKQLTDAQFRRANNGRPVWSYSSKLFFSPFVFATEHQGKRGGGGGGDDGGDDGIAPAGPRLPYFVRPFDNEQFASLDETEAALAVEDARLPG